MSFILDYFVVVNFHPGAVRLHLDSIIEHLNEAIADNLPIISVVYIP
ncbi:hypothetical protein [Nostoc sp.]